jgi:hypothetical protein
MPILCFNLDNEFSPHLRADRMSFIRPILFFRRVISHRTQINDSRAAPKTLPFNGFSHFAESALARDLTSGRRCGRRHFARRASARFSKTRMNTQVLRGP